MYFFVFMCFMLGLSLDFDGYKNDCVYVTNLLKNYIKYNCIDKVKLICSKRTERHDLSKTGLTQIKDALFKHQNEFPISDSILVIHENDSDYDARFYTELLPEYRIIYEWSSTHIGDVLFIMSVLKEKDISREYLRVYRCYVILLDEFIHYLYNIDIKSEYTQFNDKNLKLLKCIMTDLAMTKREENLIHNVKCSPCI